MGSALVHQAGAAVDLSATISSNATKHDVLADVGDGIYALFDHHDPNAGLDGGAPAP